MTIYRIQLFRWDIQKKEGVVYKDKDQYRDYCLKKGILACGWPAKMESCSSLKEYIDHVEHMFPDPYKNHKSWKTSINALEEMKKGDLCWTLGGGGKYYLGEIMDENPVIVDSTQSEYIQYPEIGIFRRCNWKPYELNETPGKVVSSLIRGGTLHKIDDPDNIVENYSRYLLDKKKNISLPSFIPLLHPDDLEDLLGLYLQKERGYYIFPSTNKHNTPLFEYVLVNKKGELAVIQCKIGGTEISDKNITIFIEKYSTYKVFIATVKDKDYCGKNIETIKMATLQEFATANRPILPKRIQNFLDLSKQQ
ncbi:MAG: hypothetical protein II942_03140 [Alphaproteobacteria bacterium]|nr:hypothetical protein [Alphaproteobacteria bacterium]